MPQAGPAALVDPDRLAALRQLELLDTPSEEAFDRFTRLASRLLRAPVSLVSLIDEDRQFFKSCLGLDEPYASQRETPLSHSFCQHVVADRAPLIIEDARANPRVRDNLAVPDMNVIAYLGMPLTTSDGFTLGSFCVIDHEPRRWSHEEVETLRDLTETIIAELELRREMRVRVQVQREFAFLIEASRLLGSSIDYEERLHRLADLVVPTLADWCVIDVVDDDSGKIRPVGRAHVDPEKRATLLPELERMAEGPLSLHGRVRHVVESGQPEIYLDVTDEMLRAVVPDNEQFLLLRELGIRSVLIVPLTARGRTLGTISLIFGQSGRRYDQQTIELAGELAQRAAIAIDNARLYCEARDAVHNRDAFISVAAHELRHPLTGLLGYSQLLERQIVRDPDAPPELRERIRSLATQARRLNRMTRTLLDTTQLQEGYLSLETEELDLIRLLNQVVEDVRRGHTSHRISLSSDAEEIRLTGDGVRLEQVFYNLLNNAIKYSPDGGRIDVRVTHDATSVSVEIEDEGIGIPQDALETLWTRFYRAPNAEHRQIMGMGLGLFVVNQILRLHHGSIEVSSVEGEGSAFRVTLPLMPAPAAHAR